MYKVLCNPPESFIILIVRVYSEEFVIVSLACGLADIAIEQQASIKHANKILFFIISLLLPTLYRIFGITPLLFFACKNTSYNRTTERNMLSNVDTLPYPFWII